MRRGILEVTIALVFILLLVPPWSDTRYTMSSTWPPSTVWRSVLSPRPTTGLRTVHIASRIDVALLVVELGAVITSGLLLSAALKR